MTTPHRIGQVTKAEILVAHIIETAPADADPQRIAAKLLEQLQTDLGWTPPRDPTADQPPLRPDQVASEIVRESFMQQIRADLAAIRHQLNGLP